MQENEIRQVESMVEKALVKMHDCDITGALEELLQVVEIEPENVRIINLIASCYLILGEFDRARTCWEVVLRIDEGNVDASNRLEAYDAPVFQNWLKRYHSALARMDSRNYKQAAELLRQLMEENDGFVSLYELLGLCYLAMSEVEMATKVWRKGLGLDRNNKALLTYLEGGGKDSKTVAHEEIRASNLEVAAATKKSSFQHWGLVFGVAGVLFLALLIPTSHYISQKQGNALKPPVIQQENINPEQHGGKEDSVSNVVAAAKMNFSSNASGSDSLSKGEENNFQQEGLFYKKGFAAYLEADWEEASANLRKVVDMQSGSYINREALYYLARTEYLNGNLNEAAKYYHRYIEEFPASNYYDDSLYYLGCIYHRSGDDQEARKVFTELKELEPDSGYLSTSLYKEVMN